MRRRAPQIEELRSMDKLLADALTGVLKEGRRHAPDVTMRQARFQLPGLVTRRDERHASAETVNAFAPYPSAARREAGKVWTVLARACQGCVASYGQLGVHLLALGAPPTLVRRAHEAALELLEQARRMLDLGNILLGERCRFGTSQPLPGQLPSPSRVALDALSLIVDGQGPMALALQRREDAMQPEIWRVAREVSEISWTHVILAWDVIDFAVRAEPAAGSRALERLEMSEETLMWEELYRSPAGDAPAANESLACRQSGTWSTLPEILRDVARPGFARSWMVTRRRRAGCCPSKGERAGPF